MNSKEEGVDQKVEAAGEQTGPKEAAKVVEKEVEYPIYFTQEDSEEIFKLSVDIKERLDFLFRGTSEAPAVGSLADNLTLPPRDPDEYTSIDEDEERRKEEEKLAAAQKEQARTFKDPFSAFKKQLTQKKGSSLKVQKVARKPTGVAEDLPPSTKIEQPK